MGEMKRVATLQEEVMRRLGTKEEEDQDTMEDGPDSFERDEDLEEVKAQMAPLGSASVHNNSNIDPSLRSEILEEFDQLIEENRFVDADLLQALLERLWDVTTERDKQVLIEQLTSSSASEDLPIPRDDASSTMGTTGGGLEEEAVSDVAMFERQRELEMQNSSQLSLEVVAEEYADDLANVGSCCDHLNRILRDICLRQLPYTLHNGHTLQRCEQAVTEAIRNHRLSLLWDATLQSALHATLMRFERLHVADTMDALIGAVSDLLYDEILFAALSHRQSQQYEQLASRLQSELRRTELRLQRLHTAHHVSHAQLLRERQARLTGREVVPSNNNVASTGSSTARVLHAQDVKSPKHRNNNHRSPSFSSNTSSSRSVLPDVSFSGVLEPISLDLTWDLSPNTLAAASVSPFSVVTPPQSPTPRKVPSSGGGGKSTSYEALLQSTSSPKPSKSTDHVNRSLLRNFESLGDQ